MRKIANRKVVSLALSAALAFSGAVCIAGAQLAAPDGCLVQAQAATKNLKQAGVKFTLKTGKAYTSEQWWAGAGSKKSKSWWKCGATKKHSAKISGLKIEKASKAGYKKVTFTATWKRLWSPKSKKEIGNILDENMVWYEQYCDTYFEGTLASGGAWIFFCDYNTGENLESKAAKKKYDLKFKYGKWKETQVKRYVGKDGDWITLPKTTKVKVTATYPEDYDGLCLGVGCVNTGLDPDTMDKWDANKLPYQKTPWFKKNKKNIHFMRLK